MIIMIDMDDTLCQYSKAFKEGKAQGYNYPQAHYGFFVNLEPVEEAVASVKWLIAQGHEVYILTAPSVKNPLCYTEKRVWIEKYLPELVDNLIICKNKGLVLGDLLIDDKIHSGFVGQQLVFGTPKYPDWMSIRKYICSYT